MLGDIDFTESQRNISHGRNILRGKNVNICEISSSILTDGDRLTTQHVNCWISVKFDRVEYVKYMIIYTGDTGSYPRNEHGLDNLTIYCEYKLKPGESYLYTCAKVSAPIRMIKNLENGIHISFMMERANEIKMHVESVNLSEIELYTRDKETHRGCFTNITSDENYYYRNLEACKIICSFSLFAISKPLESCLCIDKIDFENEVSLSECDACDGSDNRCGGDNSYSVYIVGYLVPSFAGCLRRAVLHTIVGRKNLHVDYYVPILDLTFSKCVRHCEPHSAFFMNGTCGCAHVGYELFGYGYSNSSYIAYHDYKLCDIPCKFDEENACGGKAGISLYRDCFANYPILCDKLLKCKRAIFDHHGVCTHGCKSGFVGKHCIRKVSDPIPGEIEKPDEKIKIIGMTKSSTTKLSTTSFRDITDFTESRRKISRERNILLGKRLIMCSEDTEPTYTNSATDGDLLTIEQFNCDDISDVSLELSDLDYAKYIIIYTGDNGPYPHNKHWLDHLKVRCPYQQKLYYCAGISAPIRMIKNLENGVHLSIVNELTTTIILEAQFANISEIELYTRDDVTHRGCFTNVSSSKSSNFTGFKKCQKACNKGTFGISKPLRSCLCLDEIDFENEVSLSKCNARCQDDKCGGTNSYSVYIQEYYIPAFSGCQGSNPRDVVNIRDLTFSKCIRHCGLKITYFWNGTCGCADSTDGLVEDSDMDGYQVIRHQHEYCDIPCEFDEENACGGVLGISIYRNCATNKPILCDKLLNCKRAIFDHRGVCTHGCKSGFEGKHCMLKVSDHIPGEIEEPDEEIDIVGMTKSNTQESIDMVTSPDTLDNSTDSNVSTIKNKSIKVMANWIFSIWVAAATFY